MKIATSELKGRLLDWAVESIEIARMRAAGEHVKGWWVEQKQTDPSPYSNDWLLAGPIIEREGIEISPMLGVKTREPFRGWFAGRSVNDMDLFSNEADGPTPLIAAMRALVRDKLGAEVDVPDELICTLPSSSGEGL